MKIYILVSNTSSAFGVERILSRAVFMDYKFSASLVPTPKEFSNSCNLCVMIEIDMLDSELFLQVLSQALAEQNITHELRVL